MVKPIRVGEEITVHYGEGHLLEGVGMVNTLNEWKCARKVGRARYLLQFAQRMLPPPQSVNEGEELVKPGNGAGGVVRKEQQQAKGVEQKREEEAHREG